MTQQPKQAKRGRPAGANFVELAPGKLPAGTREELTRYAEQFPDNTPGNVFRLFFDVGRATFAAYVKDGEQQYAKMCEERRVPLDAAAARKFGTTYAWGICTGYLIGANRK